MLPQGDRLGHGGVAACDEHLIDRFHLLSSPDRAEVVDGSTDAFQDRSGSIQVGGLAATEHSERAGFGTFRSACNWGIQILHAPCAQPLGHGLGGCRRDR